jgi:hypothetical protein
MSQHLAILHGPQGEKIPVVCASEAEARALEAKYENRAAEPADDDEDDLVFCSKCGSKLQSSEDDDELEDKV